MTGGGHRPATGREPRDECGTALVEVTWLAILLLVPLLYVMVATFEMQRASFAVSAAARAAGRAYTTAPSEAAAPERAVAAWRAVFGDHGLDASRGRITTVCHPDPGNCLAPGATLTVQVVYPVALPLAPTALGGHTPSIRVEGVHRVPYGTFREDRP